MTQALERGWSGDNIRGLAATREEPEQIARDPVAFRAGLVDREAKGRTVELPDGSKPAAYGGAESLRFRIDLR